MKWISFLSICAVGCFKYIGIAGTVDFKDECPEIRLYFFNFPELKSVFLLFFSTVRIRYDVLISVKLMYLGYLGCSGTSGAQMHHGQGGQDAQEENIFTLSRFS